MKLRMILVSTCMTLLPVFPVFAADGTFSGDIGVTGQIANVDGSKAKFNEYGDSMDGLYGRVLLKYDSEDMFIKGWGSNMGYDTQNYGLEGGLYGKFKAYFNYSEIPHNLTFGAKTFYSGAGSNHLSYTPPIPPSSAWKTFDYETDRKRYEAGFSVDLAKPFFFNVSVPHEEKSGAYPIGAAIGSSVSPGSSIAEIPMPIDYTTNTLNMSAGYAKNPYFAEVSFFYSQFDNGNSALFFDRPAGSPLGSILTPDAYSLPPDNQAFKLAFKGSAKLPLNSQFSMNLATGRAQTDDTVLLATTNAFGPAFNGKVDTTNVDLVLMSHPVHLVNARLDFKYYDKKNNSDQLTIGGVTNDLLGYQKTKAGIDLDWNLPAKFNLDTAYSYTGMSRQTSDVLPNTGDNKLSAELRWRGLDFMTPKIAYEWMRRDADHVEAGPNDVEAYIWRYDVAPQNRNTLKASVDIYPITNLDFNIVYKYVDTDYPDTVLGLQSTRSNQINLDAGYTFGELVKVNGYYDIELNKNDQFQRTFSVTGSPNPGSQDKSDYNWTVALKDNSYSWGLGSEVYLVPKKLTLLLQYDDINSNGSADFTYLFAPALTGGLTNSNLDLLSLDDYRLSSLSLKLRYTPTKHYMFTVGYAYQRFKYNTASLDNYLLVQGSNYLSGAYANPDYTANIVFVAVDYMF